MSAAARAKARLQLLSEVWMTKRYLIVGASSGVGAAVAEHLGRPGVELLTASRREARRGRWVRADVATDEGLDAIVSAVGDDPLDGLLFLGGTWEDGAFTEGYDFMASPRAEIRHVVAVNLIAPILCAQALAPALARARNPRIVFIGALFGCDRAVEVANTASKFGLTGAARALSTALRPQGIGVTVVNPGNVATEEVLDDIAGGAFRAQTPIPLSDLALAIDYVLATSADTVPEDINLAQKRP